jgi:NifB/MoaA-like Fe-S oxidoreductase
MLIILSLNFRYESILLKVYFAACHFSISFYIDFEKEIMVEARSCRNHCLFCFIDQLPEGMRKTLYFKDDDSRLSFLQGNFVTLTNMTDEDIDRIIRYRISPINVSVHTTNPELRIKMLHNRFG